ncbi:MAG: family 1 glycosylhydrolase [Gemmiger formicilis]|uniref:family 1 glycosylhydrolase n=1 Tax=Gemmiger formicilis TaxID=745368 RepID=UPI003A25FD83
MKKVSLSARPLPSSGRGQQYHSDYWAQEQLPHTSLLAERHCCDHYNRYEEDIRLLADAGLNAYRFSIEWARIEPEKGKFDPAEIEHYRKVIAYCKAHGVEPVATLLHHQPQMADCHGRLGGRIHGRISALCQL